MPQGTGTSAEARVTQRRRLDWLGFVGGIPLVAVALMFSARSAEAQVMAMSVDEEVESNDLGKPFLLPAQSTEIAEAMEDFQRYAKRGTWEKAFKSLDQVINSKSTGLVPGKNGLMIPSGVLIQQTLADLPGAGKEAYRLFHDAEAKVILEQAQGKEELEKLTLLASAHLVTSVGDTAAERLGDLYFEQGDMDRAAASWQSVLAYRPDSPLPKARLLVKTAIALARAGRWTAFEQVRGQIEQRYTSDIVELGGQKISAGEQLKKLIAEAPAAAPTKTVLPADLPLVAAGRSIEPAWQFRLTRKSQPLVANRRGMRGGMMFVGGWNGMNTDFDVAMATAVDDKRLYANFMGCHLALDLESGKLLWRNGKLYEVLQNGQQGGYLAPEQYGITVFGDRIWSTAREPDQIQQQGTQFYLVAREAATGNEVFHSKKITELQGWTMISTPLVTSDCIYIAATQANQGTQPQVLALSPTDGKPRWTAALGTSKFDPNQMYGQQVPRPSLLLDGNRLYVDTHCGAFVELDTKDGKLNWGVVYDAAMPNSNRFWYQPIVKSYAAGGPQFVDGTLFFKGMRSPRMYALNPAEPRVLWQRAVSDTAMLVGIDERRIYLAGEELNAHDLKTQKLLWSNKLPQGSTSTWPLLTQTRLYQFTPRGIYEINKENGHVERLFRGADMESLGGALMLTPKALLAISNLGVTAYPLGDSAGSTKEEGAKQAATK